MSDFPKVWMIFPKYISLKKNLQTNKSFIVPWPVKKLVIENMNMFLGLGIHFKWKTTKEYQDLYLRCDVLLLFDMFEKSRNNSGKMVSPGRKIAQWSVCCFSEKCADCALCFGHKGSFSEKSSSIYFPENPSLSIGKTIWILSTYIGVSSSGKKFAASYSLQLITFPFCLP